MSEILHIACTKIDENYTLQNLKFIQMRSNSFWVWGRDEFSSIAIEPTVSVALRRGFKKAGSVLSDIGDSWDKDF